MVSPWEVILHWDHTNFEAIPDLAILSASPDSSSNTICFFLYKSQFVLDETHDVYRQTNVRLYFTCSIHKNPYLVGGIPTPLKDMKVN